MARALLSETERAAWSTWPPEDDEETIGAYFTLADGEAEQLRALGAAPVGLATALALAAIRWIGFVPDELAEAPAAGIRRLGDQLGVDASVLAEYRPSERRAREHRRRAAQLANFADADAADLEAVGAVLVEESLVHDSPVALLRTATRRLHERQRLRPGLTVLERIVAGARAQAERETYQRVEPMLDAATVQALDRLLVTDLTLKISRVTWLGRESTSAAPAAIVEQLEKLAFLRRLGADRWILDAVPANRRRHLAGLVRRSESQATARRPGRVRHPALLCFLAEQSGRLVDEIVDRADEAIGAAHGRARHELEQLKLDTATRANEKVRLLELLLGVLLDPDLADDQVRERAFTVMPEQQWQKAREEARQIARPLEDHHLAQLDARYTHLRRFTPRLLKALQLDAAPPARPLLDAIEQLRALNASGKRTLPAEAPMAFVPHRWRTVVTPTGGRPDRRQWELCLLSEMRVALRAGQVWVTGSRRYQPADHYLIPKAIWPAARPAALERLGLPADPDTRLAELGEQLARRTRDLDQVLAAGDVHVELIDGRLLVRRLPAAERSPRTSALAAAVEAELPYVDLADLLIEVDAHTAFTGELGHAHGSTPRHPRLREQRFAALLALGCNLSYAEMGRAARIDPQQLAYIAKWYLRPEALAAANARVVDFHHRLSLARAWGEGRFSSSDGKRYPVDVKAGEARALGRYFGRGKGVTFYAWTSDQHAHYATRVVRTTIRDATYVLDGILDNQTELPIEKHTTDSAGYSDIVFALFDLLGLQFAPRLAGLPDTRLYRLNAPTRTPAGALLAHPIDTDRIRQGWEDMLRCAASLRDGTVTASLLVARLQAAGRHLPLTRALQEYGRLIKTRFVLRYLADPAERRAISRQLNKAESLHALHDQLFHGRHGHVRLHTLERQSTQAHALHLIANAVTTWNTLYIQHALDQQPAPPAAEDLATLTPTLSAHINLLGTYHFNIDQAHRGMRPLRSAAAANGD